MQLQNGTGFDDKQINVAKAVLYTLMPAGSVIKIPDSLWNGTFWGSALVGAALRGVRVVVMAPSLENAPARAFGSMVRSRELLWRLLTASQVLSGTIAANGGLLKVGIYNSTTSVADVPGRLRATSHALERHAWLRELFQFPESLYPALAELTVHFDTASVSATVGDGADGQPGPVAPPSRTLLHLKANYFASREAWRVMAREEWIEVMRAFIQQRTEQVRRRSVRLEEFPTTPDTILLLGDAVVRQWQTDLPAAARERAIFYTVLGSANQNDRSMVSDGEAAVLLASWPAVIPYLDLLMLVGQCQWIESPSELEPLLPRRGVLHTGLAHWFKFIF